jgi:anti-sigma B factor antagonist
MGCPPSTPLGRLLHDICANFVEELPKADLAIYNNRRTGPNTAEVLAVAAQLLRWSIAPGEDGVAVALKGEIDLSNADELEHLLDAVIRSGAPLVTLDLAELTFLDSTGLKCFVNAARRATEAGSQLLIVNPTNMVRRVLQISGVDAELTRRGCEPPERNRPVRS